MSDWIKCSDKMPDKPIPVLCFKDHAILIGFFCGEKIFRLYEHEVNDLRDCRIIYPTHWMSLPEPPEES